MILSFAVVGLEENELTPALEVNVDYVLRIALLGVGSAAEVDAYLASLAVSVYTDYLCKVVGKIYFTAERRIAPGCIIDVKIDEVVDYDLYGRAVLPTA